MQEKCKKTFNPFESLKSKDFRIYWFGRWFSYTGFWMQAIAQPWVALKITNDPFLVGVIVMIAFTPPLFLSFFVGALTEKHNKKIFLVLSQAGMMIISIILFFLILNDTLTYPILILLAFISGIFLSLDSAAKYSILYDLIENKNYISNAIALNSLCFNSSRFLGPALGGIVMAKMEIAYCFLGNVLFSAIVLLSFCFIRLRFQKKIEFAKVSIIKFIKEGIQYVMYKNILIDGIFITFVLATFIPNYSITMSALIKFVLKGNDGDYGYLISCIGIGAFLGALILVLTSHKAPSERFAKIMSYLCPIILGSVGFLGNLHVIAFFVGLLGFCFVSSNVSINSILQTNTKEEYRSRVMSLYSFAFLGSAPLGSLFAGYVTSKFGAQDGFIISALATLFCLIIYVVIKRVNQKRIDNLSKVLF